MTKYIYPLIYISVPTQKWPNIYLLIYIAHYHLKGTRCIQIYPSLLIKSGQIYISTNIYLTNYQSNPIYINAYISHYQPNPVNLDVQQRGFSFYTRIILLPRPRFQPWISNHDLQSIHSQEQYIYKNQPFWIPGIRTNCYSRALEPTQSVPGMNGPDGSWNWYQYQIKPITLKPRGYSTPK